MWCQGWVQASIGQPGELSHPSLCGPRPAEDAAPVFLSTFIYTFMEVSKMPMERSLTYTRNHLTNGVLLLQNHSRLRVGAMELPIGLPQA